MMGGLALGIAEIRNFIIGEDCFEQIAVFIFRAQQNTDFMMAVVFIAAQPQNIRSDSFAFQTAVGRLHNGKTACIVSALQGKFK